MPSDDTMIGPGAHDQVAHSQAMDGDPASAMPDFRPRMRSWPSCAGAATLPLPDAAPAGLTQVGAVGRLAGLDEPGGEGQPGQVGAAAGAGLVPDPVQVGPDGADADVQPGGDLGVGGALGDPGSQLPFP